MHEHVRASHERDRLKRGAADPGCLIRGFNYVILSEAGFDIISLRRFFSGCPVTNPVSSELRNVEDIVENTLNYYELEGEEDWR